MTEPLLRRVFDASPCPFLVLAADPPHFTVIDVNDAYLTATLRARTDLLHRGFFDVFPDTPREAAAHGPESLAASFGRVLGGRHADAIPVQQRDVPNPDGGLEPRWWETVNTPVLDERGDVVAILHQVTDVTAQHVAEQASQRLEARLRAGEERLRLATDMAEIGLWDVDLARDALFWPPRVKAMFGISPDVPVSMADFYAGLHPDDRDRVTAAFAAAIDPARQATYDVEYRTIGKEDGLLRWVAAKGRGVFEDDRCVRAIGTAMDITTQRAARESLRLLNEALEEQVIRRAQSRGLTWQVSPDLLCVLGADGYFEASNPAWQAALGWSETELTANVFFAFVHPDDIERTRNVWIGAVERQEPATRFENRYRTTAGDYRWLSWVGVPEGGKVYCSARDITAEKVQAVALAERTAERDRLWNNARDLLLVIDTEGNFRAVNPAWTAVLGWTEADLLERSVFDFVHPDDMTLTLDGLARAAAGPLPVVENRYRHRDGSWRWISWVAAPAGGLITANGRDVTDDKAREAELDAAREALRQAQKMDAVGQLTGGIAHDFNNLLQGVAGCLDLIRRKPDDPARVLRWAEAGLKAADRGTKLTGQLLTFSRSQKIEATPLFVPDLVRDMRELLERTLGPQIDVVCTLEPDCPAVLTDPTQLEMAVLNLAINARDAMAGAGALTIAALPRRIVSDPELPAGDYVELSVTDTGFGMPPEVAARAFDPFFTTKDVGRGTGLGLSQVYGVARQAAGTARIESQPGRGTTVRLFLRRTDRPLPASEAAAAAARARATHAATVLVIDDDADVRRFLVESLDSLGFVVLTAETGQEALALLEQAHPDLLLLDFAMPGMNGADIARAARRHRPDLPLIFASGYADTAAIEDVAGRHAAILRKPFRVNDLHLAVAQALSPVP